MQNSNIILWDFNGTLLDDAQICVDAVNILLRGRDKKEIDCQTYRDIFTFPVRDYYVSAGFDFSEEPFEKPALEFISHYDKLVRGAVLFEDVRDTLEIIHKKGYPQMVLSAMQQDFLDALIDEHGIRQYFTRVSGIDNHYADGKIESAKRLLKSLEGHEGEIILIGDTLHDYDVARELGIRVILIARGHQSAARLKATGAIVVDELNKILDYI